MIYLATWCIQLPLYLTVLDHQQAQYWQLQSYMFSAAIIFKPMLLI